MSNSARAEPPPGEDPLIQLVAQLAACAGLAPTPEECAVIAASYAGVRRAVDLVTAAHDEVLP